jgi:hypothetical protein
VPTLILKLVVTPALIGASTLAGRRWGAAVSGWLVALPLTSGPVALFLALDHGTGFAARAAQGMLAGTISQAAFAVGFGWLSTRGYWAASVAGCLAFAGSTLALDRLSLSAPAALLATVAAVLLALRLLPAHTPPRETARLAPRWDLPLRMAVATTFVVTLTAAAPLIGPQLSGLLSPFPFFAATLAVFAHRLDGPQAAVRVLQGLLHGLLAPAVFFFVLAGLLVPAGTGSAFAVAGAAALATQGAGLLALRAGQTRS